MDNLGEMDKFLREVQFPKTETGWYRKYEQTDYRYWNWMSEKKLPINKSVTKTLDKS